MSTQAESKQLNNEGFSLLELLIAVVILAVIVIPIMNTFMVSMRTNAKAERTMDATSIAESIMEEFEGRSIEEMKSIYEGAGFSVEATPDTDVDGKWIFVGNDADTTGKKYQVEITLDPSVYSTINSVDLVNVQNLVGSMNAVFSEKKDAETEGLGYFKLNTDKSAEISPYVDRIVNIKVSKNLISVDLGGGETKVVDTYLVTAECYYECTKAEWLNPGTSSTYPQSNTQYVIFSNEEAIKKKAEEIKEKKAAGMTLEEEDCLESRLANVVICVRPRATGGKDRITVENGGNVAMNLYLVRQGETGAVLDPSYCVEFNLKEKCESGWNMVGTVENVKAACQLRTNFLEETYVTYKYTDVTSGSYVSAATATTIMQTDTLTPVSACDRMYDIVVNVYEDGTRGTKDPLVTMTGTVTN